MQKKVTVVLLSLVMVFSLTAGMSIDVMGNSTTTDQQYVSQREQMELEILTGTLGEPIGMQGFEGEYAINSPEEMVEIIVQFATPPAGALQLIHERGISLERALPGTCYYKQALLAHDVFIQQLAEISTPFDSDVIEITSYNYWLFNGVFMRVPGAMVELIAQLPEVHGVFPDVAFYHGSDTHTSETQDCPFFVDPEAFMRQTREYLNLDYINNEMGITGDGVIVAVLDSGIDHMHPEFARFLDYNGKIRGHGWRVLDGRIHDNSFETNTNISQSLFRAHGTTVSGAVVGIAPGIELWHFRVAGSGVSGLATITGLEEAERAGAQVINMSLGSQGDFTLLPSLINLVAIRGVVVVTIAGNDGERDGSYSIWNTGSAPLSITVGAGTAGGLEDLRDYGDSVRWTSSLGPVLGTHHIKPDIIAPSGLRTTNLGGRYTDGLFYGSGTSHAAPIIAGVAALLIEAFPNDTPYEIKARIMNTARPMTGRGSDSVFSTGAGFVQPLAALRSDTIVTVEHYVPLGSMSPIPEDSHRMASLSFGGMNASNPDGTMPIFIENRSNTPRTYTISRYFQNNRNGVANLSFSTSSITVPANSTEQLYASMFFAGDVRTGFYDGFVYVRDGATVVARLPFAGVVTEPFYAKAPTFQIAFHLYTPHPAIIDRFSDHATQNTDGIYIINVPVTPGKPHHEWPNQALLQAALEIGPIFSVTGIPGHSFWGWFTDETLDTANRPLRDGLRRPGTGWSQNGGFYSNTCEWEYGATKSLPGIFALLQDENITTAQKYELFGNNSILNLYAIWTLWGDLSDDGVVGDEDRSLLRDYLLGTIGSHQFNSRAANVNYDGVICDLDLILMTDYLRGTVPVYHLGRPSQITDPPGFIPGEFRFNIDNVTASQGDKYAYVRISMTEFYGDGFSSLRFGILYDSSLITLNTSPRTMMSESFVTMMQPMPGILDYAAYLGISRTPVNIGIWHNTRWTTTESTGRHVTNTGVIPFATEISTIRTISERPWASQMSVLWSRTLHPDTGARMMNVGRDIEALRADLHITDFYVELRFEINPNVQVGDSAQISIVPVQALSNGRIRTFPEQTPEEMGSVTIN